MSNKINDSRLEDLQAFLGEHDFDLEHHIRYSVQNGFYAFKDVDDDDGQTIGINIYELPEDIQNTLLIIRNIPVEERTELVGDYPVKIINL